MAVEPVEHIYHSLFVAQVGSLFHVTVRILSFGNQQLGILVHCIALFQLGCAAQQFTALYIVNGNILAFAVAVCHLIQRTGFLICRGCLVPMVRERVVALKYITLLEFHCKVILCSAISQLCCLEQELHRCCVVCLQTFAVAVA